MKKIHKSPIRKIITFCIIASFILCMTCSSYERAGSFFAASLPISTNFSILYHNSNYNMTEIQSPPVQAFFEQGIVEILETTNVVIIQQSSQLRTIGRVNRLSSLLQVLFLCLLFNRDFALCRTQYADEYEFTASIPVSLPPARCCNRHRTKADNY